MKVFRTTAGPFPERPHYELREIEQICLEALKKAGCLPERLEPIRIDWFVEKHFGIVPSYDELPDDVLGYTSFQASRPSAIVVSRALDAEGTVVAERRIRTTIAHEAGHILLQGHLFALMGLNPPLFTSDSEVSPTQILCRAPRSTVPQAPPGYGYDGKWWEYQANRAIGSLLLPKTLVLRHLEPFLIPEGRLGARIIDPQSREKALLSVAEAAEVNPVVARRRIDELFPNPSSGQLHL